MTNYTFFPDYNIFKKVISFNSEHKVVSVIWHPLNYLEASIG